MTKSKSSNNIVLVIEDDEAIRESLESILADEGYEVYSAGNGQEGLNFLTRHPDSQPSLILLDLTMPVMNGVDFLKIQKMDPRWEHIPVAVFTAARGNPKPELADEFLKKPIELDALLALVEKYCRSSAFTAIAPTSALG